MTASSLNVAHGCSIRPSSLWGAIKPGYKTKSQHTLASRLNRKAIHSISNRFLEQFLQFAAFMHFSENIRAADEFTIDI